MAVSALAYKKRLTLDEGARLMVDGNRGIGDATSLLRGAVEDGDLECVRLVRHRRYVMDLGTDVPDPEGHADIHETIIERSTLIKWIEAIDFLPRPKALFPASPPSEQAAKPVPGADKSQESPWLQVDSRDPVAVQPWYTPARYFARQLVKKDPTILHKRLVLADSVSKSLKDFKIFKRGNKEAPIAETVLKAFANLDWT